MRKKLYSLIPDLCKCGCNEIVWNGKRYIYGHHIRINNPSKKGRIVWNKGIKTNISPPNKFPYPPIPDLCWCGCGQIVYGGKRFIRGHWAKTNNGRNRISEINKGKLIGDLNPSKRFEVKEKISKIKKGRKYSDEIKKKMSENHADFSKERNPFWKRKHSKETKKKMSENHADCSGKNSSNWQGGKSFLPYCEKWTERLKEQIRNEFNRRCYICNKNEKDNITKTGWYQKLSIHHIDMDKEQGCNGKSWKLIPLCMNCHGKIHKSKMIIINNIKYQQMRF